MENLVIEDGLKRFDQCRVGMLCDRKSDLWNSVPRPVADQYRIVQVDHLVCSIRKMKIMLV